jgi:hypothetical protein
MPSLSGAGGTGWLLSGWTTIDGGDCSCGHPGAATAIKKPNNKLVLDIRPPTLLANAMSLARRRQQAQSIGAASAVTF